jgi:hypothetical protein
MKWMPWSSSEQRRHQLKDGAEGGGMQGVKEIQGKEQEGVCGLVLLPPLRTLRNAEVVMHMCGGAVAPPVAVSWG